MILISKVTSGFFEEFRGEQLTLDIEELEADERRLTDVLKAAVDALGYYRERIKLLKRLTS